MPNRTPLQHLLRTLVPGRRSGTSAQDFQETQRNEDALDRSAAPRRPTTGWAESAIDLELGTEIMEFPEDTAAGLLDEYFPEPRQRAS